MYRPNRRITGAFAVTAALAALAVLAACGDDGTDAADAAPDGTEAFVDAALEACADAAEADVEIEARLDAQLDPESIEGIGTWAQEIAPVMRSTHDALVAAAPEGDAEVDAFVDAFGEAASAYEEGAALYTAGDEAAFMAALEAGDPYENPDLIAAAEAIGVEACVE